MEEPIRLYAFDYQKPELEDAIIHYGVKGMKWGVRKDRRKAGGTRKRAGSKVKTNKRRPTKEDIIKNRDLKALSRRRNEFSTQEINEVLNRINTEQRLDDMLKKQSPQSQSKVRQILKSPEFKKVATVALISLPFIIYGVQQYRYNKSMVPGPMDFNNNVPKFIMTDIPKPQAPNVKRYTETLLRLVLGIKVNRW